MKNRVKTKKNFNKIKKNIIITGCSSSESSIIFLNETLCAPMKKCVTIFSDIFSQSYIYRDILKFFLKFLPVFFIKLRYVCISILFRQGK